MTAAYRLKSVWWFAACTAVVLAFYLVSLQVAAERKTLEALNGSIAATQRDIRALETEFDTRANLAQLERWNGDTLALAAPRPEQFVRDAAEFAATDPRGPLDLSGAEVKTAMLVVPSLPGADAKPSAAPSAPAVAKPVPVTPAIAATVRMASAKAKPSAPVQMAEIKVKPARAAPSTASPLHSKPEVAMLDHHLLSDSTLGDLLTRARVEKGIGR